MEISQRIIKIIENRFQNFEVKNESNLVMDLGADSLELMELVMDLEDEFGMNIPQNYIDNVKTVEDIIHMMENYCDNANDTME